MIEFLAGNWQEFIFYTPYVSIALYLIFNISYHWLNLQSMKTKNYRIEQIAADIQYKYCDSTETTAFRFLKWLPRTIRLKVSSKDETDGPFFSSINK